MIHGIWRIFRTLSIYAENRGYTSQITLHEAWHETEIK